MAAEAAAPPRQLVINPRIAILGRLRLDLLFARTRPRRQLGQPFDLVDLSPGTLHDRVVAGFEARAAEFGAPDVNARRVGAAGQVGGAARPLRRG